MLSILDDTIINNPAPQNRTKTDMRNFIIRDKALSKKNTSNRNPDKHQFYPKLIFHFAEDNFVFRFSFLGA